MSEALDVGTISGRVELDNQASGVLEKIEGALARFGEGAADRIKGAIEDPMGAAKEAMTGFTELLGPVGIGLGAVITVAAAAGYEMFELASHASEAGESVLNFSRITGTSVEEVGALGAAATIGGSSLEQLQSMLFQITRRMSATGEAAEKFDTALAHLGISADEFRKADPSEKIRLLSEAMHAAEGSTTMMTDALAIMGRGAMTNLPFLMKNFEELHAAGKEVAVQWTGEGVASAEKFAEAQHKLGVEFDSLKTKIGMELMPAMTDLMHAAGDTSFWLNPITAVKELYHAYTDLGGSADGASAGVTAASKATHEGDAANRAAAASAMELAKAQEHIDAAMQHSGFANVSADMRAYVTSAIEAGAASKDLEVTTGLSAKQITIIAEEGKKIAATAAKDLEEYNKAWEAVNATGATFKDTLAALDPETVKYGESLLHAGVSAKTVATALQLADGDVKAMTEDLKLQDEELKKTQKAADEYADAWDRLSHAGETARDVLQELDKSTITTAKYYLSLGMTVKDVATALEITDRQAKAASDDLNANAAASAGAGNAAKNAGLNGVEAFDAFGNKVIEVTGDITRMKTGLDGVTTSMEVTRANWAQAGLTGGGWGALNDTISGQPKSKIEPLLEEGFSLQNAIAILQSGMDWHDWKGDRGPRVPGFKEGGEGDFGTGTLVMLHGKETITPEGHAGPGGGASVVFGPGAIVMNYPIMNDARAMDQLGKIAGDAVLARMRNRGYAVTR